MSDEKCDQIGQFFDFSTTFQCLWQKLFCPICPHFMAIFVKVSISFIFQAKLFLGNFLLTFGDFFLVTLPTSKRVSARASERARERDVSCADNKRDREKEAF